MYGLVRGNWCTDGPHIHTEENILGNFRAYDESLTAHISGNGNTPHHNNHKPGGVPCSGHSVSLQHIHTMVSKGTVLVNNLNPVLDGDEGCWSCPCHDGEIFDFTIKANTQVYIEGRQVVSEGQDCMDSGSLHGGNGVIINGGSKNVFVGTKRG